MDSPFKAHLVAILLGMAATLVPSGAWAYSSAPLTICNKSPNRLVVAVGYHSPGVNDPADHSLLTGPFVSKGWWQIESGACQTIDNPFSARYIFWYGWGKGYNDHDLAVYATGSRNTPNDFCVSDYFVAGTIPNFTYEDENSSRKACEGDPSVAGIKSDWITPQTVDTWVSPDVSFAGQ